MKKGFKLSTKLVLGFGFVILLIIALSIISLINITSIIKSHLKSERLNEHAKSFIETQVAHYKWSDDVKDYIFREDVKELDVIFDGRECILGRYIYDDEISAELEKFPVVHKLIEEMKEPHLKLHQTAYKIKRAKSMETAQKIFYDETNKLMIEVQSILDKIKAELVNEVSNVSEEISKQNNFIMILIISMSALISLFAIIIAIIIIRSVNKTLGGDPEYLASITKTISKGILSFDSLDNGKKKAGLLSDMVYMTETLEKKSFIIEQIANGDLTSEIELASKDDEVGNSLIKMSDTLNNIIRQISVSTEQVTQGANQVADSSQNLSHGASQQASSLEEITASLNEISGQTQANTEGAVQAFELARQALENAQKGSKQMNELVEAMDKINKSANDIKNVVKIIDDIAFQTNLLALNADIEAARVGKYGKGFAVVANSVRNLATKSQKSVRETTKMVEEAINNIERGNELVKQTSEQLEAIKTGSENVASISNEVSESSQEQTQGIEQISTALSQVEDVVQSNSANAEENAAASEELSAQAGKLRELISYFRLRKDEMSFISSDNNNSNHPKEKKELMPYNNKDRIE